jgi:hypothetical protein
MSTVRRFFLYVLSFITLGMGVAGTGLLISLGLDLAVKGAATLAAGRPFFIQQQLSLGVALLVIGAPLWWFFWRSIRRNLVTYPAESGAALRRLFLSLVLGASAGTGLVVGAGFLTWLLGGAGIPLFSGGDAAAVLVCAPVWFYHWRVAGRDASHSPGALTLRRWYVYILSAWGLAWLTAGLVRVASSALLELPVWGGAVQSDFWGYETRQAASWVLLGIPAWYFHWFRAARGDIDSTLRQVYLFLFCVMGGVIASVVAVAWSLDGVFLYFLGGVTSAAGSHFQFFTWTLPLGLAGAGVWLYHQRVTGEEAESISFRRQTARRVYLYLVSFIGLMSLAAGVAMLVGSVIDLSVGSAGVLAVSRNYWREQLSIALAIILYGAPLWVLYWRRVVAMAAGGGLAETGAVSRRVFLYGVVVIAILALVADLVFIIYRVLNSILQGQTGLEVLRIVEWAIGAVLAMAPVLAYHWRILMHERKAGAEPTGERKTVTLILPPSLAGVAASLETELGYRVKLMVASGDHLPLGLAPEALDQMAAGIRSAPPGKVMVVMVDGALRIIPYQDR